MFLLDFIYFTVATSLVLQECQLVLRLGVKHFEVFVKMIYNTNQTQFFCVMHMAFLYFCVEKFFGYVRHKFWSSLISHCRKKSNNYSIRGKNRKTWLYHTGSEWQRLQPVIVNSFNFLTGST